MSKSVGRSKASKKTRKNSRNLEEEEEIEDLPLEEEIDDLDLDDLSDEDLDYLEEEEGGGKRKKEPSMSKEINKMINSTIKDIKDGDMAIPAIGLGLVAIIGFAIYKGAKI